MERRPFEIQVDGKNYLLELGNCAVVLFRYKQEVDYLAISQGEDTLRAFENPEICRWMAGYKLVEEEGYFMRPTTVMDGMTFREEYGWNPSVVEKESPTEKEEEWFLDTVSRDIDQEWSSQE